MQTYACYIIAASVQQSHWPRSPALEGNVFANTDIPGTAFTCRDTFSPSNTDSRLRGRLWNYLSEWFSFNYRNTMGKLCRSVSTTHMLYSMVITHLSSFLLLQTRVLLCSSPPPLLSLVLCYDSRLLDHKVRKSGAITDFFSSTSCEHMATAFFQFTFMVSLVGSLFLSWCHIPRSEIQPLL